jgi:prepilin-type processing-associated H-X9-DG protein
MKCRIVKNTATGLTLREVLVAVVSLGIFLVLIFSSATACNRKTLRIHCTMGVKQVAQGLGLWANEHEGQFPMEVAVSAGGAREPALAGNLLPSLLVATNHLGYPGPLICPADTQRQRATNFASLTTSSISYFLNIDATYTNQSKVIAGDRDITTNGSLALPGLLQIPDPSAIGWANILHKGGGNVGLIDGSVHQVTSRGLRDLLTLGGATNRLIIP